MNRLVFHHNHKLLPQVSKEVLPVQLYSLSGSGREDISFIGSPVIDKIKRLGVPITVQVMDFLTIALAVTAADTFVRRADSADGWTRHFSIQLPLNSPDEWRVLKDDLEKYLHFLSGDIWEFHFRNDGYPPPTPYSQNSRFHLTQHIGTDCVCLFSGGLDSAIGVIDLLKQGRKPLLVSHGYKGDRKCQDLIEENLTGQYSRFVANADPRLFNCNTDITMRTRSMNFLAFAAVGACAVQSVSQAENVDLFVPENGFISLNAPLTSRRIGTLSTRTTHPHFIEGVQNIFEELGLSYLIKNPYQFKTKGQMVFDCLDKQLLSNIVNYTVSCSHWKRSNQQCGVCVPCIIRRASLQAGGIQENIAYSFNKVLDVMNEKDRKDDVMALAIALSQKEKRNAGSWIADSGPLPPETFENFKSVFLKGLDEVEIFLKTEGVV